MEIEELTEQKLKRKRIIMIIPRVRCWVVEQTRLPCSTYVVWSVEPIPIKHIGKISFLLKMGTLENGREEQLKWSFSKSAMTDKFPTKDNRFN